MAGAFLLEEMICPEEAEAILRAQRGSPRRNDKANDSNGQCTKQIPTLWLFNSAMENCPFIDGLPFLNMGIFHGYVK